MSIRKLDHVNIRTARMDLMIEWYGRVLGLQQGDRPNFRFPGAWLYAGDTAVIHLVASDGEPGCGAEGELKLEHFALSGTGREAFESKLDTMGLSYRRSHIEEIDLVAYHLSDPDGNHLHVDFPAAE